VTLPDGVDGLLADDDAGLVRELASLLGDDELLERIKTHNYENVPLPEWGTVVQMHVDTYQRAIALTGKPEKIRFTDKPVAIVRYRDGSVIDTVYQVAD